jgi:hypothetical protein
MKRVRLITRFVLSGACALLSSCIDTREEYWLEPDGSGRAEFQFSLPAAAASLHGGPSAIREQINGFLKNTPEITASSCDVLTENDRVTIKASASFKSALDFKNLNSESSTKALPSAALHLIGEIRADLHGRTVDFSRTISHAKAVPGHVFIPASQVDGHRVVYIMHLPAAATDSNATRTEDSGRTLVWDIPLADAFKRPVVTSFKMNVPIPWKLVTSIAVPLSLAGGFVFRRIRKSRKIR